MIKLLFNLSVLQDNIKTLLHFYEVVLYLVQHRYPNYVNIALANEIANVCSSLNIDAKEAISLSNKHPRVFILDPGIGVGGHCIPIDPGHTSCSNDPHDISLSYRSDS